MESNLINICCIFSALSNGIIIFVIGKQMKILSMFCWHRQQGKGKGKVQGKRSGSEKSALI